MNYWIMLNGVRIGPVSLDDARRLPLKYDTPVWRTGLPDWCPAEALPEFAGMFTDHQQPAVDIPPVPGQPQSGYRSYYSQAAPRPASPVSDRPSSVPPKPDTYLAWSIIVTLLCCLIPGIVAIFYATKVSSRYYSGDYEGARKASSAAAIWIMVAIVCGLIWIPFQVVLGLLI